MISLTIIISITVLCIVVLIIAAAFLIWWKYFRTEPYVLPEGFFRDDSKKEEGSINNTLKKNEKDDSISHPNNLLSSTSAENKHNSIEHEIIYLKNFFSDGTLKKEQSPIEIPVGDLASHPNHCILTIKPQTKDCVERGALGSSRHTSNLKVPNTKIPIIFEELTLEGGASSSTTPDLSSSAENETSTSSTELERFCIRRNSLKNSLKKVASVASNTQDTVLNTMMGRRRGVYEVSAENEMRELKKIGMEGENDETTEVKGSSELVPLKRFAFLNTSVLNV